MQRRTSRRAQRGVTLIDAMLALAVVTIGAVGALQLYRYELAMNADARRMTTATALAQDLVEQIALWNYTDARLANANTSNDADLGDTALAFQGANPPYDHAEADLTSGGATWNGLPSRSPQYERYWNVSYVDDSDANGVWDGVRIAVIVRWPTGTNSWRRIVLMTSKINPAEVQ